MNSKEQKKINRAGNFLWYEYPQGGCLVVQSQRRDTIWILNELGCEIWKIADGSTSREDIVSHLEKSKNYSSTQVEKEIMRLLDPPVCLLKIQDTNTETAKQYSKQEVIFRRVYQEIRQEQKSADELSACEVYLDNYHKGIKSFQGHFDLIEHTVSHIFREKHGALYGKNYGQKLFEVLSLAIENVSNEAIFLEVGAGLGSIGISFFNEFESHLSRNSRAMYIFLDISPMFVQAQKEKSRQMDSFQVIQGNARNLPFENESVDFVLANEAIADFGVAKVQKAEALGFLKSGNWVGTEDKSSPRALQYIKQFNLSISDALPTFLLNIGAIEFLLEIGRILKKGGVAVIIEYGSDRKYPTATYLRDHTEYSIHFGHLMQVAKDLGFDVSYTNLLDFLGCKEDEAIIDSQSLVSLSLVLERLGKNLRFLPYTPQMLKDELGDLYNRFHNVLFHRLKDRVLCFDLRAFKAMVLKKRKV